MFVEQDIQGEISIKQNRAQVGSSTVYYQVAGEGPPVVLLHGLSGSGRWWKKNVAALARHFRVYVVDLMGFGRSSRQRFILRQASRTIEEWMESLNIECYNLIGHSMGGFIAADLAARRPERVDHLALVDAAAVPIRGPLVRVGFGLVTALRYLPFDFLPVLALDALRAGPLTLLRASWDILHADISADLSKIETDTIIIWGERDALLPLEMGERLHQALPRADYVIIEGAGHNPMWDCPEHFNQAIIEFIS